MAYFRIVERQFIDDSPMYRIEFRESPMGVWNHVDNSSTSDKDKVYKYLTYLVQNDRRSLTTDVIIHEFNTNGDV